MTITRERRAALREDAEAASPDPYAAIVNGPELIELLDALDEVEWDRIEQIRTKVAIGEDLTAANDAIQRVRDLHTPFEWSFGEGPVTSCRACADVAAEDDDALSPCPTIRALDGTGDNA